METTKFRIMHKIRLNLVDTFSGCTDTREMAVDNKTLKKCEHAQINRIPQSEFSNNIRYTWIIEEVERLS